MEVRELVRGTRNRTVKVRSMGGDGMGSGECAGCMLLVEMEFFVQNTGIKAAWNRLGFGGVE